MTQRPRFLTGVGRLVGGSVFEGTSTGYQGVKLTRADNVTPRTEYFVRVAFPKSDPLTAQMLEYMKEAAHEDMPALFRANPNPKFSWKWHDGDTPREGEDGLPKPLREETTGCIVVDFKQPTTMPAVVDEQQVPITDPAQLPRGYYVRISMSAKGNGQTGKTAGLFVTDHVIQRCAFGEVIVGGVDVATALAAPIGALPAGASATPIAPAAPLAGAAPIAAHPLLGMAVAMAHPDGVPGASAPYGAPVAAAPAPVTAMPGFGAPPAVAPAPPAPAPPPAAAPAPPAGPQMTAAATNTYAEYKEAGWDDGALVRAGLIVG